MQHFDGDDDVELTRSRRKKRTSQNQSFDNNTLNETRVSTHSNPNVRQPKSSMAMNGHTDYEAPRRKRLSRQTVDETETSKTERSPTGHPDARRRPPRKARSPPRRMPRSVSEEVLAMEGQFHPDKDVTNDSRESVAKRPRKSRTRSDPADLDAADSNALPESKTADISSKRTVPKRSKVAKKKKRTRGLAMFTSGEEDNYQADMDGEISEIFEVDQEDIVVASDLAASQSKINVAPTLPSQPLDFMFIEKKDGQGFAREHKSRLATNQEERTDYQLQLLDDNKQLTTLQFVCSVHSTFRALSMICHGLLAGLTLAHIIFVYMLSDTSDRTLLENYHKLALPFQSMFNFLLSICAVSVLQRFVNISGGCRQFVMRLLSRPSRGLSILFYLLAFLFSVSLARLDDRISFYNIHPSLWTSTDQLAVWKIVNLLRMIGAVIGWCLVAASPTDDLTAQNLKHLIDETEATYVMKPSPLDSNTHGSQA